MRLIRAIGLGVLPAILGGCGLVHFGRRPAEPVGDAKLAAAYSDLALEHKMLKQELALARQEGDTLRVALDRSGAGSAAADAATLVAQLNASSQELAKLRSKYSELERVTKNQPATVPAAKNDAPVNAAATAPKETELQAENGRLRAELDRARAENADLIARLTRNEGELAQAKTDLAAQKAARAQLETKLAVRDTPPAPASSPAPIGGVMAALQFAKAPPADSSPMPRGTPAVSSAIAPRVHVVQPGDTPESIATRYYGAADRWRTIQEANAAQLPADGSLPPGLELRIP